MGKIFNIDKTRQLIASTTIPASILSRPISMILALRKVGTLAEKNGKSSEFIDDIIDRYLKHLGMVVAAEVFMRNEGLMDMLKKEDEFTAETERRNSMPISETTAKEMNELKSFRHVTLTGEKAAEFKTHLKYIHELTYGLLVLLEEKVICPHCQKEVGLGNFCGMCGKSLREAQ